MTGTTAPGATTLVRAGVVAWSVTGLAVVAILTGLALAAVSELVLPLVFAVMIGVALHPLVRRLRAHLPAGAAAAVVVVGLALLVMAVVLLVATTVVDEMGRLSEVNDGAVAELDAALDDLGVEGEVPHEARARLGELAGMVGAGLLTAVVGGIDATVGFVAGSCLALFLLYYVLKDGAGLRDRAIAQLPPHLRAEGADFVAAAARSTSAYWAGRTVLSAVVALVVAGAALALGLPMVGTLAVVTFLGGFVPYIGAFLGGGLAVVVALSHGGVGPAAVVLVVVVLSNVGLENVLEPRVMSGRLDLHPMLVLVATTAGGVLGGLVGLMLAVPLTAIGIDLVSRARLLAARAGSPGVDAPLSGRGTPSTSREPC